MLLLSLSFSVTKVPEKSANITSSVQKAGLPFPDCGFFFCSVETSTLVLRMLIAFGLKKEEFQLSRSPEHSCNPQN